MKPSIFAVAPRALATALVILASILATNALERQELAGRGSFR